jgi:ribosomal protein L23
MKLHSIILTEKACFLVESAKYTFLVDKKLKKKQLKALFTDLGVGVKKIHTLNLPAQAQRPCFKKVILTLKEGERLALYPE